MKNVIKLAFLVFTSFSLMPQAQVALAQSWSGILAPSRAIDWTKAGLPASFTDKGGSNVETTTNPWTPPTRTQSGSTINPSGSASTDLANINTALSNCTDGRYVLLGPGTFLIQGTIVMYQHSCTLRGSGAQSTILSMSGSAMIWMGAASAGGSCTLTNNSANFTVGATTLICNGLSGSAPAVNDIIQLTQCDTGFSGNSCSSGASADNGSLFVCGYQTTCMTEPSGSGNNASQLQNFVVTSVSNSSGTYTIGVNTGLYMPNWAYAQTARLSWNNPTYNGIGVGLEDMTIYTASSTVNWSIYMSNTFASWIKGLRFIGSAVTDPMAIIGSKNGLLANSYCFAEYALNGYLGCVHTDSSSDILLLNNIWTYGNYEADGGDTGEVDAYNYEFYWSTMYPLNTIYDHRAYDSFRLEEGNQLGAMYADDTWGTHGLYTFFRNYSPCYDVPYTTYSTNSQIGFSIGAYQRFHNAIGNAAGSSECTNYSGAWPFATGVIFRLDTSVDPLSAASFMRWGNVSAVTQSTDTPADSGIRFVNSEVPTSTVMPSSSYPNAVSWQNPVPGNDNLPCSLFLSSSPGSCSVLTTGGTGLSWWKVCKSWSTFPTNCSSYQTQPFPIAGPDLSGGPYVNGHAYDNPASIAWQYLPIDTAYQNSYTITASSWSGGTETLTVSGLPNVIDLTGPFQLGGVSTACSTGATFGGNNEILITGSSSTTVQYALPSNPGTSCTGTMKFPDVRQFDERVYQADPSGSAVTCGEVLSTDTSVTLNDAVATAQYAIGLPVTINVQAAEVDGTSTVDLNDAVLIAQYVVGLATKLTCPG